MTNSLFKFFTFAGGISLRTELPAFSFEKNEVSAFSKSSPCGTSPFPEMALDLLDPVD